MQEAKEEVRSRLNIEDVIGEYVQLKRAGRNFKGLSPFTSEKTPSFFVSPDKQIWHDFSSNKGGDVFSFIMEVEGLDFRASLEYLAHKAGVDLSIFDSGGSRELSKLKKRLLEAHNLAASYYQQSLVKNQHAMDYVFKVRGLSKQIVQDFKIGYAPDSVNALTQFLSKKGFTKQELSKSGLVNRFGGDLFRGRMMISLMDTTGKIIGFTGRIISDNIKNAPKYLNTSQTFIYDKSRHVFGLSQAKEAIRNKKFVVIVEGNLDVISSHQVDIKNVVATAGTAITEFHLKAISRLTNDIRLAFDSDSAGIAATERAITLAQGIDVDLSIVSLPDPFKDPDEAIKKDKNIWQDAIDSPKPAIDWVLGQYASKYDLKSATGKRKFTSLAANILKNIVDPVEKEHYIAKVADYIQTPSDVIKSKLLDKVESKIYKKVSLSPSSPDPYSYQDNLLSVALIDASTHDLFKNFPVDYFESEMRQEVAKYIISNDNKVVKDTPKELQKYDTYVKILLLKADARYADWNDSDRYFETARLLRQVTNEHKKKQKTILTNQLRDAEIVGDDNKADELRTRLNDLIKEIQSGQR